MISSWREKIVNVHINILHELIWTFWARKKEEEIVEKQEYLMWYNEVKTLAWREATKSFIILEGKNFPSPLKALCLVSV